MFVPSNYNLNLSTQVVELERLRRELAYRKQLHEQQNAMISQQRAQLSMGQVIHLILLFNDYLAIR